MPQPLSSRVSLCVRFLPTHSTGPQTLSRCAACPPTKRPQRHVWRRRAGGKHCFFLRPPVVPNHFRAPSRPLRLTRPTTTPPCTPACVRMSHARLRALPLRHERQCVHSPCAPGSFLRTSSIAGDSCLHSPPPRSPRAPCCLPPAFEPYAPHRTRTAPALHRSLCCRQPALRSALTCASPFH